MEWKFEKYNKIRTFEWVDWKLFKLVAYVIRQEKLKILSFFQFIIDFKYYLEYNRKSFR